MNNQTLLEEIKVEHQLLYERGIAQSKELIKDAGKRKVFIDQVDCILKKIYDLATQVSTIDDYKWLNDSATALRMILTSTLNTPLKSNTLPPPKQLVPPLPDKILTEDELNDWRSRLAEVLGIYRMVQLGRKSSSEEMDADWYKAQVYFASDVLKGFPNFAGRIGPDSYWRLEEVWLKSVKKLRAYFIWLKKDNFVFSTKFEQEYFEACNDIRFMLINKNVKAQPEEFDKIKSYIEINYLSDGKLDRNKAKTSMLISRKAERIWKVTGETNTDKNWYNAETYSMMFYENIIPAILYKDEEHILTVLKAFQYSKTPENNWWIINCFEVAIAIYFLDPDIIMDLWKKSNNQPVPESSIKSIVYVNFWPEEFQIPEECRKSFEYDKDKIIFIGLMKEKQKEALLRNLYDNKFREAIDKLFIQSRLIHEERTL